MAKEREIKVGKKVLTEDDLKFTVMYEGDQFTLRYPTPFEIAVIEADIAKKLGGFPRESFEPDHVANITALAYVNQLVIPEDSPSWFKSAWTCYDDRCIVELYNGYLQFRGRFQDRLRGD